MNLHQHRTRLALGFQVSKGGDWRLASLALFLAWMGVWTATRADAVTIIGYDPILHDRFSSGYATAPVPNTNPAFIGAGLDLSGVGWDAALQTRSVTMISDEYFVYSSHYAPGAAVSFFSPSLYASNPGDPAGAVVTYSVSGTAHTLLSPITGLPGDFRVGKLATPLNPAHNIAAYPILNLPALGDYIGLPLIVYGHGGSGSTRLGTNTLDGFIHYDLNGDLTNETFAFGYSASASPTGEARLEAGDSSSPTFVVIDGTLTLIGTHSAIGTLSGVDYSFDNFIPVYLSQMSALGIEFTAVPEPSRFLLLQIGLIGAIIRRRRVARCHQGRSPHPSRSHPRMEHGR